MYRLLRTQAEQWSSCGSRILSYTHGDKRVGGEVLLQRRSEVYIPCDAVNELGKR